MGWIWHMCISNMKRRGTRTILTILGVIIGIISVVSMLAVSIGVKNELMKSALSGTNILEIDVYSSDSTAKKSKMLTDDTVSEISEMDDVTAVYPMLSLYEYVKYDKYEGYLEIIGVPEEYFNELIIESGSVPDNSSVKPELLLGKDAFYMLWSSTTGTSYEGSEDDESLTGEKLTVYFETGEGEYEDYRLTVSGETGNEYDYAVYTNLSVLKSFIKRISNGGNIEGQPLDSRGKSYSYWVYDSISVMVSDMDAVEEVSEKIQDMGFQAENEKETVDTMQHIVKISQLLLGGIGMIALVVAVIGIANTMTTAVYDRINDVGVLKVLGCDRDELMFMFLIESGILGAVGGLIGIVFSYGVKFIINHVAVKMLDLTVGTELAVIPVWLAAGAVIFACLLGILAGYFPARWATKINPIDAVRSRG